MVAVTRADPQTEAQTFGSWTHLEIANPRFTFDQAYDFIRYGLRTENEFCTLLIDLARSTCLRKKRPVALQSDNYREPTKPNWQRTGREMAASRYFWTSGPTLPKTSGYCDYNYRRNRFLLPG